MISDESNDGEKNRYVMLPSRYLSFTDEEFEKAENLFCQHGSPLESN